MENSLNLQNGLEYLQDQGLIKHNDALAVRRIEPANTDAAGSWLLWAAFDIEHMTTPPDFRAMLESRISNVGDCFRWLENLDRKQERQATWDMATQSVRSLSKPDIAIARIVIKSFTLL